MAARKGLFLRYIADAGENEDGVVGQAGRNVVATVRRRYGPHLGSFHEDADADERFPVPVGHLAGNPLDLGQRHQPRTQQEK